jgi:hypothetical protein
MAMIAVQVLCASGRFAEFIKSSATSGSIEELTSGGANTNQVSGVSFGQLLDGEVVTHAVATITAAGASYANYDLGFITSQSGEVAAIIQGGQSSGLFPALHEPLKVSTGMLLKAQSTTAATTVVEASLGVYYSDGSAACFQATGSDAANAAFTDVISGSTWGQTGAGKVAVAYYCTLGNTNTVNEDGNGNNFGYFLDAQGTMKGGFTPAQTAAAGGQGFSWYNYAPVMIDQNDTANITYAT